MVCLVEAMLAMSRLAAAARGAAQKREFSDEVRKRVEKRRLRRAQILIGCGLAVVSLQPLSRALDFSQA